MVKTPRKTVKPMSFSEFGQNFMNLVITEDVLQKTLDAGIPKSMSISEPGEQAYNAKINIQVGHVERNNSSDEGKTLLFTVPIDLQIDLDILLWGTLPEHHDIRARPVLNFAIYCVEPLGIKIDIAKISAESVKVDFVEGGWAVKLGHLFGQVDPKVRNSVAKSVNDGVAEAEEQLYIDVLGKVQETFKNSGAQPNSPGGGKPPAAVKEPILQIDAEPLEATLGEDQLMRLALPPNTSDTSEIITLARFADKDEATDAMLAVTALDEDGGVLAEWSLDISADDSGWRKKAAQLWGHEIGSARQVFIEVKNVKSESGSTAKLDVKVKRIAG